VAEAVVVLVAVVVVDAAADDAACSFEAHCCQYMRCDSPLMAILLHSYQRASNTELSRLRRGQLTTWMLVQEDSHKNKDRIMVVL